MICKSSRDRLSRSRFPESCFSITGHVQNCTNRKAQSCTKFHLQRVKGVEREECFGAKLCAFSAGSVTNRSACSARDDAAFVGQLNEVRENRTRSRGMETFVDIDVKSFYDLRNCFNTMIERVQNLRLAGKPMLDISIEKRGRIANRVTMRRPQDGVVARAQLSQACHISGPVSVGGCHH